MNRECAGTITSTGNNAVVPSSSGIRFGGNHKIALRRVARRPHQPIRRIRAALLRTQPGARSHGTTTVDPDQPTRSASTVAGISGNSASNARTRSSNGVNDVASTGARSYFGGSVDATAFDHRVPRDPQPLSDLRLRHPLRGQPPNQRPVLQSDHTPIVECSLFDRQDCSATKRRLRDVRVVSSRISATPLATANRAE